MARSKYQTYYCATEGCSESVMYDYSNRKELFDMDKRHRGKRKCLRHSQPEGHLSVSNTATKKTLTTRNHPTLESVKDLYWDSGSGFVFGTGYLAYANDFPVGTRLVVTAEIILPTEIEKTESGELK